jgi:hypothetical protein
VPYKDPSKTKEYARLYYSNNSEKIKARSTARRMLFHDEIKEWQHNFYLAHRKKINRKNQEYHDCHREKLKAIGRIYYLNNQERIKKSAQLYRNAHLKEKREHDRIYYAAHREEAYMNVIKRRSTLLGRIEHNLRSRINFAMKGRAKTTRSIELVGCTVEQLRKHIESKFLLGMNWDNYGFRGWHIDHIIPCAMFDLLNPEQQKKCFHWSNLQPLWATENLSKGIRVKEYLSPCGERRPPFA